MKNYRDGGEAILEALRALDVDYIFSSPGSDWGSLWEALARQKVTGLPGPTYVSCGHETLAVNLAMGNTFLTGRMQAVVLHTGVGLLQGSIAIDAAHRLNQPMLIFSSEAVSYGEMDGFDPGQQWIASLNSVGGPQRLVEPIVKWASSAANSETLFEMIVRAGELAQQTPAGPVYLNVPIETLVHEWVPPKAPRKVPKIARPQAPEAEIEKVAALLAKATHPVIITEGGGRDRAGYEALSALAETFAVPVVESWPAEVSNFPKDNPLHQGFSVQPFAESVDLALLVRARVPWYPSKNRPPNATVVVIDEMPVRGNMVYQNLSADLVLEGDVTHSLRQLAALTAKAKPDAAVVKTRRERAAAAHGKRMDGLRRIETEGAAKATISAEWVCHLLGETLPADTIYVDETITYRPTTLQHLMLKRPESSYRVGGGLGQGFGTALGLKVAAPDRFVTLILGDGAFLYNPGTQSLAFSAHEKKPVLVVILNNSGYRSMAREHRNFYPQGIAAENDLFYGRDITEFDYAELARPFGGYGKRVTKPAEVQSALDEAVAAVKGGKTAILNIAVE